MISRFDRTVAQVTAACAAAVMVGCASQASFTEDGDSVSTKREATSLGATLGGALIPGGDILGAALGKRKGEKVASTKQDFAAKERELNQAISATQSATANTRAYNASLRSEIASLKSRSATVSVAGASAAKSREVAARKQQVDAQISRSTTLVRSASGAELASTRSKLNASIRELERERDALDSAAAQLSALQ